MNELPEMSLMEHLHELRRCLMQIALSLIIAFPIGWYLLPYSVPLITEPFTTAFGAEHLVGTKPGEAFTLKLQLSFFTSFLISFPIIAFQIWRFVLPALYPRERKFAIPFMLLSTALFIGGVAFCYASVVPLALAFFQEQYSSLDLKAQIHFSEYTGMLFKLLIVFGICFELPVVTALLAYAGILTAQMLVASMRYAVVIIFIIAAVLTPPDVVSQVLLAVPLLLLYGVSIGVAKIVERSHHT